MTHEYKELRRPKYEKCNQCSHVRFGHDDTGCKNELCSCDQFLEGSGIFMKIRVDKE